MSFSSQHWPPAGAPPHFTETRWSLVLLAGRGASPQASDALETLCRTYWRPIYAFLLRRGHSAADAQDLTQEFFSRLLASDSFRTADPLKGRFRSFLLGALNHFLANEWKREHRLKRGGDCTFVSVEELQEASAFEPGAAEALSPENVFDRRWAEAALAKALSRLQQEFASAGKEERFDALKVYLLAEQEPASYADTAARLGISEGAVKWAIHHLRQRYGELVRAEVAQTLADPREAEEELRHLLAALSG
jgi:RNA polymerase sigma factor (sigma-70 family)